MLCSGKGNNKDKPKNTFWDWTLCKTILIVKKKTLQSLLFIFFYQLAGKWVVMSVDPIIDMFDWRMITESIMKIFNSLFL